MGKTKEEKEERGKGEKRRRKHTHPVAQIIILIFLMSFLSKFGDWIHNTAQGEEWRNHTEHVMMLNVNSTFIAGKGFIIRNDLSF